MANFRTDATRETRLGPGMQHLIYSSERLQYEN